MKRQALTIESITAKQVKRGIPFNLIQIILPAMARLRRTPCRVTAFGMTSHCNAHLGKVEPVPGQRMPIVFFQMRFPWDDMELVARRPGDGAMFHALFDSDAYESIKGADWWVKGQQTALPLPRGEGEIAACAFF